MVKCSSDAGQMCAKRLDEEGQETTVGQRLLKEPIWIGLIVILSVVMLFGVLYIIRRKCGKHFNCCEIKKPKPPDNNILNADGTITLNSFPLRKIARPPALTPISASPPLPRIVTTKSDTPTPTPGVKNEGAAARFFASYKDAERSPIAAPLTTDFSRTTDTSLSQDSGDASVGAMVAGRLQLDLHIRENKEEQEAMTRTHSLLDSSHRTKEKIKRSHSTGPMLRHHDAKGNHPASSPSSSKDKRVTINDFEHIYPNVIVHSPDDRGRHSDEDVEAANDLTIVSPESIYVDTSGAHVIEVNEEGDSEEADRPAIQYDHKKARESWKHHSHSADSIYHLESDYPVDDLVEKEKLEIYATVLREWKSRARQRYRIAKLATQKEKDEYYSLRSMRSYDHNGRKSKSRSTPTINRKSTLSTVPIRRTHTVEEEPVYLSDVVRKREQFSCKPTRLYSSFDELNYEDRALSHKSSSSRRRKESNQSSCDCPTCVFNRSESMASDMSSVSRSYQSSRDRPDKRGSYRDRRRKEKEKFRSISTTSDQSKYSRRQRTDSSRHRHAQIRHNSSARSLPSLHLNPGSSTDSENMRNLGRSPGARPRRGNHPAEKKRSALYPQVTMQKSAPLPPPTIKITETSPAGAGEKDLFRKVFSEEIELDDFSPGEEDDADVLLRLRSNSKENFLSADHSFDYSFHESNNNTDNASNHLIVVNDEKENSGVSDTTDSVPIETRRRNSVVTVKTGSFEATPISKRRTNDKPLVHGATTSSESPGTPSTCSVIVYDSNKTLDNHDTPPTIKSHSLLSRKHSSLDLAEPLRLLQPGHQVLRNASSMHDLSNTWLQDECEVEEYTDSCNTKSRDSELCESKSSSTRLRKENTERPTELKDSHSQTAGQTRPKSSDARDQRPEYTSSLSSSENVSPQQRRDSATSNPKNSETTGSSHHLSVTDTDSAMSSAPSSQTTPNACKTVLIYDRVSSAPKVKDSAYQTKQSSTETDTGVEIRARRPVPPIREEDRKVTQRLHQAAVKLLVMQQRLRRARQNMSKDSAVHTISEDDATMDDFIVTSPKTRTYKPGVLYPAGHPEEEIIHEFPPLQCARIVEEQDVTMEYEV